MHHKRNADTAGCASRKDLLQTDFVIFGHTAGCKLRIQFHSICCSYTGSIHYCMVYTFEEGKKTHTFCSGQCFSYHQLQKTIKNKKRIAALQCRGVYNKRSHFCADLYPFGDKGIWGIRAFPVSLEEKVLPGDCAVPSGLVTCSVGYDTAAIYVDTFSDIETENGTTPSPAKAAGMKEGDVIVTINGQRAKTSDFITKGPTGEESLFEVVRLKEDGSTETVFLKITPVYSVPDDRHLIGILYYDSILPGLYQTLQTVSFFYPDNGYFAATAHSSETENASYYTNVLKKAVVTGRDETGLTASVGETLGEIAVSNRYGSFGYWENQSGEALPIGKKSDVRLGRATLLSSFEQNEVKEYEAFVTGTYRIDNRDVICLVVNDDRIRKAGGVTRGMSGSPIIQNGKIIGALSNTDSEGYCSYATFAYDMAHEIYLSQNSITDKKEMAQ